MEQFELLHELRERRETCWKMAKVFFDQRDAHGIHDMGVEIQALERAIAEVGKVTNHGDD